MQNSCSSALRKPIINKVVYLNEQLLMHGAKVPRDLKRAILDGTKRTAAVLFIQAMRQLKGRDYIKRAIESAEEIQANVYLIFALHGWSNKVCAQIDQTCDDIINQLYAIANSQAHGDGFTKSKD